MAVLGDLLMASAPARPGDDLREAGRRAGRGPEEPDEQPADLGDRDGDMGGTAGAVAPFYRALIVNAASASSASVTWRYQPRQLRTS